MSDHIAANWLWRSREPAQNPPDENYPFGIAVDLTNGAPGCLKKLQYPAPGVGSWVLTCARCNLSAVVVTAAGRADDPTQVKVPCKFRRERA